MDEDEAKEQAYSDTRVRQDYLYSLESGFVDASLHPDAPYQPRLLANSSSANVFTALAAQMRDCERFDFSVAFVAKSGISAMLQQLLALQEHNIPGRLLTSTYLDFNQPDALERLSRFSNIELRVYEGPLHTKGYFFKKRGMRTLVVGSSNFTQSALFVNREWNLLVHSYENGSVWQSTQSEFERLWNSDYAKRATPEWLEAYRANYRPPSGRKTFRTVSPPARSGKDELIPKNEWYSIPFDVPGTQIVPNTMQKKALAHLSELRDKGARRALLISATGTGKTYLAAFDVKAAHARRALFIVHRETIAKDALESFRRVNGPGVTYGLYSGAQQEKDADYLFCTIQLLDRHLDEFPPDTFDYIIVDEAHRSGAPSYQRALEHFKPRFLLGMTATPDRTDGYDVYALYDHHIAYRITLQDAEENKMLAPFHYFGIHDLRIDGEEQDDVQIFRTLTSEERVDHIIHEIDRYSVDRVRRGLVFCSRVDEAWELARCFNQRGIPSLAVDGDTSPEGRRDAIERLQCDREKRDDWVEYLFTVDIFNEGIDIPALNQIIMLRPTESAIVFVQQLGRGLRLYPGKDYVLVLDFIGNYQKNFLIPVALSGDRTYNKDNLRRFVREGSSLAPGCSTISFDAVAEKAIYESLDSAKFSAVKLIKEEYLSLKNMMGRVPKLMDFYRNGSIDPQLIFSNQSLGSYHRFLQKYEKSYHARFDSTQESMLEFVSRKLASGKRPQELLLLKALMEEERPTTLEKLGRTVRAESASLPVSARSVACVLGAHFMTGSQASKYAECAFATFDKDAFSITPEFREALADEDFRVQMQDLIELGLAKYHDEYQDNFDHTNLVLYRKYTYEDVCRLLDWDRSVSGQNIGGYFYDEKTNTFPVFINYEKGDDISETTRYEDRFVTQQRLIAISKSNRKLSSKEIVRLQHYRENGMKVYLFMRKNKDDKESKEFYFLGEMAPVNGEGSYREFTMPGTDSTAVEIAYDLQTPVPDELFDYLTSGQN